jgi:hypothetical protein
LGARRIGKFPLATKSLFNGALESSQAEHHLPCSVIFSVYKMHPAIAINGQFDRSHKSIALFCIAQEKKRMLAQHCRCFARDETLRSSAYD